MSLKDAGLAAGYSPANAEACAKVSLRRLPVQQAYQKRIAGLRATTDEVHALLASHLRADIADLAGCYQDNGTLNLKKAKKRGVSRLVKKYKTKRAPIRDKDGQVTDWETTTEIEIHDSQSAAKVLSRILGMEKLPDTNPAQLERESAAKSQMFQAFMGIVERLLSEGVENAREAALAQVRAISEEAGEVVAGLIEAGAMEGELIAEGVTE